jgi:hypothetical protein
MKIKKVAVVGAVAAAGVVALSMTSAQAQTLFGSSSIRDNSIQSVDVKDGTLLTKDLSPAAVRSLKGQRGLTGAQGPRGVAGATGAKGATGVAGATGTKGATGVAGAPGAQGPKGDKGDAGLLNAFYATANYDLGDTNEGAIATVACDTESSAFTAIAGGVQVLGLDSAARSRNTPVSSSFPGRMDWSTNAPKANRLDGWIVQFGGNAGAVPDKAPEKVKLWALCVPSTDIPVHETFVQSQQS